MPWRVFFDSFLTLSGFRARRARNGSVAGGGFLNPRFLWASVLELLLSSHPPRARNPKDPSVLKTLRIVNHYGGSNSLPQK